MYQQFLSLFLILISSLSFATEINSNPLKAKGYLQQSPLPAGANTTLILDVTLDEPHIAYTDQFRISTADEKRIKLGSLSITNEITFDDVHSKKKKKGIKGYSEFKVPLEIAVDYPLGDTSLPIRLTYQACTDEYCLLPKTVAIPVEVEVVAGYGEAKNKNSIGIDIQDNWLFNKASQFGWFGIFLAIFFSGILTSFTPCIFPVIPMTLAVIGHGTEGKTHMQGFLVSFVYVTGIALVYSTLGLIVASTGALFGSYLGHPLVNLSIALIFFAMAASMFGAFELEAPRYIRNRFRTMGTGRGYSGAFGAGLLAGVIASPCVGPVLVAILAFVAKTQDLFLGFALLLAFAYGMGLIFLILGTFSSLVNRLPKSGMWMVRIKQSFGVIMIGLGLFYLEPAYSRYVNPAKTLESTMFEEYSEEKLKQAQLQGKAVVIDFWADWCVACKDLEKNTFPKQEVQALRDQFIFLKYDATVSSSDTFQALQEKYDIIGLPHLVFYDREGNYREDLTLTGFEEAPEFSARMKKALKE